MDLLKDKVAVISGGTKGIGLAIANLFKQEGATVIIGARNKNEELDFDYHSLDIADRESCREFYDYVVDKYGKVDVLVNNAGIMKDRTTAKMSDEEFDDVVDVNLVGTFNMVRLFGPLMQSNGYGSIINFSSFVASSGNIGQANYVASKAAIEGMTKCWAKEFARKGENVRVNAIAPGVILTDIFNNTPKDIVDGFAAKTVLKRLGEPEEIAKAVLFLASDMSSYVTATVLHADGGIVL